MRRGIAALGALALVGTLAACGGGADQSGDAASGAAEDQSGTAGVGTLTIWAADTRYGEMQEFAKDFTAETQIELSVVQKSESDMDQEFITQVPTGKGPDLIVMAHDKLDQLRVEQLEKILAAQSEQIALLQRLLEARQP